MKTSKKAAVAYTILTVLLVIAIIIGANILENQRKILDASKDGSESQTVSDSGQKPDENKKDDKTDGKKLQLKDLTGTILKLDNGIEFLEVNSSANLTISNENYPACVQSDGKDGIHYTFDAKDKKGVLDITATGSVTLYLPDELKELTVVKKGGELSVGQVEAKKLVVTSETGDYSLNGCKAEYLEASVSTASMKCYLSPETKKAKFLSTASHLYVYLPEEAEGYILTNPTGSAGITDNTGFAPTADEYGTVYGEEGGVVIEAETSAGGIYIYRTAEEE